MNTRKILLISSDAELINAVRISALTLTKLNCQVSVETEDSFETALKNSKAVNLDLIIIDNCTENISAEKLITSIRKNKESANKKIILIFDKEVEKQTMFNAGCDSVMSKEEFRKVVNNILVF